jgi:hypothetical protein
MVDGSLGARMCQVRSITYLSPGHMPRIYNELMIIKQVVADHRSAQNLGINGIPGAVFGSEIISGAVSLESYQARKFIAES